MVEVVGETRCLPATPASIEEAARLIRAGQPVAVPTETVYGLAADATSGEAVAAIYQAKGRPTFNPLIIHVADVEAAARFGMLGAAERALAAACWPGPLTIVVPLRADAGLASLATAGLSTVALRVPAHPVMRALLAASGRPLAAPSANASGTISPTRAAHVLRTLGGRIPLVLDDGPCPVGLESTIVQVMDGAIHLLRPGPIAMPQLMLATGLPAAAARAGDAAISAPGQLAQHYAPAKPLRLETSAAADDEWLIGFGPVAGNTSLSPSGDLTEAAARLFDLLHEADAAAPARIAVAPVPHEGFGRAINDRLRRAAA